MTSVPRRLRLDALVAPFADLILRADLPDLPSDVRRETVGFVARRTTAIPAAMRAGLAVAAAAYRLVLMLPAGAQLVRWIAARPLPLLGEYPRLVRSLGYAFIWERWPDTSPTGAPP